LTPVFTCTIELNDNDNNTHNNNKHNNNHNNTTISLRATHLHGYGVRGDAVVARQHLNQFGQCDIAHVDLDAIPGTEGSSEQQQYNTIKQQYNNTTIQ
jgi:hypothetical protein